MGSEQNKHEAPASDFALRRFLRIAQISSVPIGLVVGFIAGPAANLGEAIHHSVTGGAFGLVLAAWFYVYLCIKDLANLDMTAEEMNPSEIVLQKSTGIMTHYKSGSTWRFWEAVGGRLFLTNQALVFRTHRGQPWMYQKRIPLDQISEVSTWRLFGYQRGGLRVRMVDGSAELFNFGVWGNNQGWARDIGSVVSGSALLRVQ